MSTLQDHGRTSRRTLETVLAAASLIIVVAVGAFFLTLNHPNQPSTTPTHTQTPSPYLPTIQIPGAGLAHIIVDPHTGQAHGTVTPPIRGTQPSGPTNAAVSNLGHRADP